MSEFCGKPAICRPALVRVRPSVQFFVGLLFFNNSHSRLFLLILRLLHIVKNTNHDKNDATKNFYIFARLEFIFIKKNQKNIIKCPARQNIFIKLKKKNGTLCSREGYYKLTVINKCNIILLICYYVFFLPNI